MKTKIIEKKSTMRPVIIEIEIHDPDELLLLKEHLGELADKIGELTYDLFDLLANACEDRGLLNE